MAGPWEAFASTASGPWADFADKPKPNVGKDMAQSGATGIARGLVNLAGQVESVATPVGIARNILKPFGVNIPGGVGDQGENLLSRYGHKPETRAGRYTEAVGEQVPNALAPGGLVRRGLSVIVPGIAGEAAREGVEAMGGDERAQGYGKLAGNLLGGSVSQVRRMPGPRGAPEVRPLPRQDVNVLNQRAAEYRASGIQPTLIDVMDDSGRGAVRAAASRMTPARQRATDFQDARIENLPDRIATQAERISPDRRSVAEMREGVDQRITAASAPPGAQTGSAGHTVSARLNREFDATRSRVNQRYDAARDAAPDQAVIPGERLPQMAANIREAVRDFDPHDVPRVTRQLGMLDTLSTPTMRDMFDLRSRLTNLRASNDQVEATAAARAVHALDAEIAGVSDHITGDPAVVGLWQSAIAERRQMGQQFQGDDLIQQLTQRERRGGGMTNTVAPEDASAAMFGRSGVTNRPNSTRDLMRLRDRLGADSPEWSAVQDEALTRVLQRDGGSEDYGAALGRFSRDNPELADLLFTPAQRQRVAQQQQQLTVAIGDRNAIDTGQRFMTAGSGDAFSAGMAGMTPEQRALAQAAARRAVEVRAGEGAGSAPGVARKLAIAPEQQARNAALMGEDRATRLQDAMRLEERSVRNANDIAPRFGSQTQVRGQDAGQLAGRALQTGRQLARGDYIGIGVDWLKSRGMNDQQAEALVNLALDPARTDEAIGMIGQRFGPQAAQEAVNWRNAALIGGLSASGALASAEQ